MGSINVYGSNDPFSIFASNSSWATYSFVFPDASHCIYWTFSPPIASSEVVTA